MEGRIKGYEEEEKEKSKKISIIYICIYSVVGKGKNDEETSLRKGPHRITAVQKR